MEIRKKQSNNKLIFAKRKNEARRHFTSINEPNAYALYEELLSHKHGFRCQKTFIMSLMGWKHTKVYSRALKVILDEGYAQKTGSNRNMVITLFDEPQTLLKELRTTKKAPTPKGIKIEVPKMNLKVNF